MNSYYEILKDGRKIKIPLDKGNAIVRAGEGSKRAVVQLDKVVKVVERVKYIALQPNWKQLARNPKALLLAIGGIVTGTIITGIVVIVDEVKEQNQNN